MQAPAFGAARFRRRRPVSISEQQAQAPGPGLPLSRCVAARLKMQAKKRPQSAAAREDLAGRTLQVREAPARAPELSPAPAAGHSSRAPILSPRGFQS